MRTLALFVAKNVVFFEIYGVSATTSAKGGGLSQCGHFSVKRRRG